MVSEPYSWNKFYTGTIKKFGIYLSNKAVDLIKRAQMTEHFFMIAVAILIGVLAGFGAVGIRLLIKYISSLSFPGDGTLLENIQAAPWYFKLIVPAIGGLIVGPIIYFFAPEAKGHGVPEVMQSILLRGGHIRSRVAFVKAFASSVTIGTGGSVGREGPIIQIGSSIGSTIGQFFRVSSRRMKTLVGCGAAAGIAAAFNAPVAGALFAVEIILMDFAVSRFSPIVISSVMATVVSHYFEGGDIAAFQVTAHYQMVSHYEILFYFILGGLCGLVSWAFIKILYFSEDVWDNKIKVPGYLKAMIGGAVVGGIALYFPQIMGVGYDSISNALNDTFSLSGNALWYIPLTLIFVKIIATSVTLGSGGSGGIFAPSLFMGAMAGFGFGVILNMLFPGETANPGAYALVAMGGLVAGTTRAPITAIIIVFEMTKDYTIILPLMIVCIISMILSQKLSKESIYTLKLLLRNITIKEKAEVNIMKSIHVSDIYTKDFIALSEDVKFDEIVKTVIYKKVPYIAVNDRAGNFMGMISLNQIKNYVFDKDMLNYVCIAGDIADKGISRVTLNDNSKTALDKMSECNYDGLPVMDTNNSDKMIGMVWRKDIDEAYRQEIDHYELTSDLASKITMNNTEHEIRFLEGYSIAEIPAPESFFGKTIRELSIRNSYGVDIISIKSTSDAGRKISAIPNATYIFQSGDSLIVAGRSEDIFKLKIIK